jgi:gamma-glutamyltranspeptidase/glutathione hydrolase
MVSPITLSACVFFIVLVPVFGQGQGCNYGRSMVITQQGIAATSQTLASQTGAQILAKGGSAVDAAIAANAVLAVMEPMKNGLAATCSRSIGKPVPAN